jgi:hypothetical protein
MPDAVVVDSSDTEAIHPNIIERPDTLALYVVGNRGPESMMTTLVFNSAAFGGIDWTWRTPNLAWETNASRGFSDATDLAWDPVRFVVVVTYDITHTSRYGVIRLDASGAKEHLDTPSLELTNNEWGVLQVDASSGDYFLFAVNLHARDRRWRVARTRLREGDHGPRDADVRAIEPMIFRVV